MFSANHSHLGCWAGLWSRGDQDRGLGGTRAGVTLGMASPQCQCHPWAGVTPRTVSPLGWCHPRDSVTPGLVSYRDGVTPGMVSPQGAVWLSPLTPGSCSSRPSGAAAAPGTVLVLSLWRQRCDRPAKGTGAIKTTALGQGMVPLQKGQEPWKQQPWDGVFGCRSSTTAVWGMKTPGFEGA